MAPIVIVGSGFAGYTLARELRKLDRETPLAMVTTDDGSFYSKPMLSNALASGKGASDLALKTAATMAKELNATLHAGTEVQAIDLPQRRLRTSNGDLAWSKLVLALGADPIRLPLAGDAAGAVLSVNDLGDYARFRAAIEGRKRVAILGAGLIGCEFANDLVLGGHAVEVADIAAQALGRLLPPEAAAGLRDALGAAGVRWHLGKKAVAVDRAGSALVLRFEDGTHIETDIVLSAVGLAPRTALARGRPQSQARRRRRPVPAVERRRGLRAGRLRRSRGPGYALRHADHPRGARPGVDAKWERQGGDLPADAGRGEDAGAAHSGVPACARRGRRLADRARSRRNAGALPRCRRQTPRLRPHRRGCGAQKPAGRGTPDRLSRRGQRHANSGQRRPLVARHRRDP